MIPTWINHTHCTENYVGKSHGMFKMAGKEECDYHHKFYAYLYTLKHDELIDFAKENPEPESFRTSVYSNDKGFYKEILKTMPHYQFVDIGFEPENYSPIWIMIEEEKTLAWFANGEYFKHGDTESPLTVTKWMYADDMHRTLKRK